MKHLKFTAIIATTILLGSSASARTFTYLENQVVTTIDPAKFTDESSMHAVVNMYDPFLYPKDAQKSMDPGAHIAQSWTIGKDGRTYTFKLRNGVKFHDGTVMTADDVVYSFQRFVNMKKGYSWLFDDVAGVEDIKAVDKDTVRFVLKKSYAPFLASLTQLFIVNKKLVEKNTKKTGPYGENGDYGEEYINGGRDVGSGPYEYDSWDRTTKLSMNQFKNYWRGWKANQFDKIDYLTVLEDATTKAMLNTGKVDMIDQWRTPQLYAEMKKNSDIVVEEQPGAQLFHVQMDTSKGPTSNLNFRKAVALAFDYKTALNQIFQGGAPAAGPVASIVAGHDNTIKPYSQDIEQAKKALAASGYKSGQVTLEIVFPEGGTIQRQVALLLQANLSQIGVKLKIQEQPWATIVQRASQASSNPQLAVIADSLKYPHVDSHTYGMYHPSAIGSYRTISRYDKPVVTKALEQARAETNVAKQIALYKVAQQIITKDYPSIYIANPVHRIAYRKGIKGYRYVGLLGYDMNVYNFTY